MLPDSYKGGKIAYGLAAASAEFFADILLCPWEVVKLKVQTQEIRPWLEGKSNGYGSGLIQGTSRLMAEEGIGGAFSILTALWGRQIPYTVIKFVAFGAFIKLIYEQTESQWGMKKSDFSKGQQLGWTFVAGYAA